MINVVQIEKRSSKPKLKAKPKEFLFFFFNLPAFCHTDIYLMLGVFFGNIIANVRSFHVPFFLV